MAWMVSQTHPLRGLRGGDDAGAVLQPLPGRHARGVRDRERHQRTAAGRRDHAYQYGGGGGFESPLLRDPEAVREDVLDEYVSVEAARERYGVVLTGSVEDGDLAVDADTAHARALRAEARGQRRDELRASASTSAAPSPTSRCSTDGDVGRCEKTLSHARRPLARGDDRARETRGARGHRVCATCSAASTRSSTAPRSATTR